MDSVVLSIAVVTALAVIVFLKRNRKKVTPRSEGKEFSFDISGKDRLTDLQILVLTTAGRVSHVHAISSVNRGKSPDGNPIYKLMTLESLERRDLLKKNNKDTYSITDKGKAWIIDWAG